MEGIAILWLLFLVIAIPYVIKARIDRANKGQTDGEEARFQREHPEAWEARERVKLAKERLEAEKALAEQQLSQERSRRNASFVVGFGRGMGWW